MEGVSEVSICRDFFSASGTFEGVWRELSGNMSASRAAANRRVLRLIEQLVDVQGRCRRGSRSAFEREVLRVVEGPAISTPGVARHTLLAAGQNRDISRCEQVPV
jgi:hypothetical protein